MQAFFRTAFLLSLFSVFFLYLQENVEAKKITKEQFEMERGYYLITFHNEKDEKLVENFGGKIIRNYEHFNILLVELDGKSLEKLKRHKKVKGIEKNKVYKLSDFPRKQETYEGLNRNMNFNLNIPETGKGVGVAVLDSGIDINHEDLKIVEAVDCANFISGCTDGDYSDENGHGTHVTGIIAAQNNNIGTRGVAPGSDIYAVRVSYDLTIGTAAITDDNLISGLNWVYDKNLNSNNGNVIDIVNMSLGLVEDDFTYLTFFAFEEVIKKLVQQDVLLVASAGNESCPNDICQNDGQLENINNVTYPALLPSVISVGNVDWKRENQYDPNSTIISKDLYSKRMDSSVGKIDISAFGSDVCSTMSSQLDDAKNPVPCNDGVQYEFKSGTSQAAPVVSGILALYKERFPEANAEQLKNMLYEQATDLNTDGSKIPDGKDRFFGYGLANPNPPKYHPIRDMINVALNEPLYGFANIFSPILTEKLPAGSYLSTKGKNWDSSKKQFEYYYLDGFGWVTTIYGSVTPVETARNYQEIILSGSTKFYEEPNTNSPNVEKTINKYKAGIVLSREREQWDKASGNYKWFKVSIPEYGIVNKWINVTADHVKPLYKKGIFDNVSGKFTDYYAVNFFNRLTNNVISSGDINLITFNANGYATYTLDHSVDVSSLYLKHNETNMNSTKLMIEFIKENGETTEYELKEEDLINEYFSIDEVRDVISIKLKNKSNGAVKLIEFEVFGEYEHTYKNSEPLQSFESKEVILGNGAVRTVLYEEPNIQSFSTSYELTKKPYELTDVYGWDYNSGYYLWYKINIPELNLYNKWVSRDAFYPVPVYKKGLADTIGGRLINFTNERAGSMFDNELNGRVMASNEYAKYRFNEPVVINKAYLKTDSPIENVNYSLQLEFETIDGETFTHLVTKNNLYKELFEISNTKSIVSVGIRNIGSASVNVVEIDFFSNKTYNYKKEEIPVTLNGSVALYSEPNSITHNGSINIYEPTTVLSKEVFQFALSKGYYNWYKVDIPEYGIKNQWVTISNNVTTIPVFKNGLLDSQLFSVHATNVLNPGNLYNNRNDEYSKFTIKPAGNMEFVFEDTVTMKGFYIDFKERNFTSNNNLKLIITLLGGLAYEIPITENEFTLGYIDKIGLFGLGLPLVKKVSIVNVSNKNIELFEFDVF